MLIVSKFYDYYDTASTYGVDKSCVYLRTKEEVKEYERWDLTHRWGGTEEGKFTYHFNRFLIGFCGKIYPGVLVNFKHNKNLDEFELYFYNKEKLEEFLKSRGLEDDKRRWRSEYYITNPIGRDRLFSETTWKKYEDVFIEKKCPVFFISLGVQGYLINPRLKEFNFVTVKDPYTAFQEIFQYMSGVLGSLGNKMIEISDEHRIAGHGFNKYSFRQDSPGKKARRRARKKKRKKK